MKGLELEACSFSPARAQRLVHIEHARVLVALVSDAFSTSPDCLAELGHALERDLRRDQAESARPAHEHHAQSRACGLAS